MNQLDLSEAQHFIEDLVYEAGDILNRYFDSQVFTSQAKEGVDFKTQVDDEVDAFLVKNIQKKYPQTEFLTEETAPKDFISFKEKNNLWIIDPLDGTTNFSRGNAHFSISVALVEKGIPRLAVVYLPHEKELYTVQDRLKYTTLNGNPISISKTNELGKSVVAVDWSWDIAKRKNIVEVLGSISPYVRAIKSMGTAAGDLASLAAGRIDAYIHSGLKPWDIAASALFIEKAGGKITTLTGARWDVFNPDILATNGLLHASFLKLLQNHDTRR